MSRQLAADNIRPKLEKQHIQYVQALCNEYAAFIAPKLMAKKNLDGSPVFTKREVVNILAVGEKAIRRANARREKSS